MNISFHFPCIPVLRSGIAVFYGKSPCFPGGTVIKNLPAKAGDAGDSCSIPGLGRSPGEGNGNPWQYSHLEKFQGQRSLADHSPRGHKESDTTEHKHTHTCAHLRTHMIRVCVTL